MALGALCVAGVALGDIHPRFTWQAWHNLTSTIVLYGRRGTHGTGWRAWVWLRRALVSRDTAALCVAGVALGDIHFRFTWQALHNLTSTFVSRGRRSTISHPPSFCVAGVALMALGGALGSGLGAPWSRVTPRHCAAGVALGDIHFRFTWQAWHNLTSTSVLRGRRGTHHGFVWQAWHSWHWVARLGLV